MMKFGTETGSLINHIYSRTSSPEPKVGMGATICMWSDRHAGTIIAYNPKANMLVVQSDKVIRVDRNGISENQVYEYEPDLVGPVTLWRKDRKGKWCEYYRNAETNRYKKKGTNHLLIGIRDEYYDFSF